MAACKLGAASLFNDRKAVWAEWLLPLPTERSVGVCVVCRPDSLSDVRTPRPWPARWPVVVFHQLCLPSNREIILRQCQLKRIWTLDEMLGT